MSAAAAMRLTQPHTALAGASMHTELDPIAEEQSHRDRFLDERVDHRRIGQQTAGLVGAAKSPRKPSRSRTARRGPSTPALSFG
jgi:hypothetical protein